MRRPLLLRSDGHAGPTRYDEKLCRKSYMLMRDFFAETLFAFEQLGVEPVGLGAPVLARYGYAQPICRCRTYLGRAVPPVAPSSRRAFGKSD